MSITMFYAGLLGILLLVLSVRVIQKRSGKTPINLGDGGDTEMLRRIRGHANFTEYVPLILVMMALLEFYGEQKWIIHTAGAVLLAARLLHGYALSFSEKFFFGRFVGTLLTLALLLALGVLCALRGYGAF